ncbi:uncharacterized protein LOC119285967 isoform X2 [Triticum dicoccoides]|uniref:uncharacterized protein LOC119285967 isoform X2 n=1 Tax=Triticum dicoccoides TaxID=85692 RepID=UPI001890B067|nr:uncharacterized protein LOC119285967 isoform X2 [Triticum dicoccoides]
MYNIVVAVLVLLLPFFYYSKTHTFAMHIRRGDSLSSNRSPSYFFRTKVYEDSSNLYFGMVGGDAPRNTREGRVHMELGGIHTATGSNAVLRQEHYGLQEAYILYNKRTKLEHSIESNENVIINLTNNELMILGMILMDEKGQAIHSTMWKN